MEIGCALMGGTFMPEFKGDASARETAFDRLVSGYRFALKTGFDYIEASAGEILALSAEEINALINMKNDGGFDLRYVNSFVRGDLKICTEDAAVLERYARDVITRVASLGAGVVVFGSGVARKYPDGMTHAEGMEKFLTFVRVCGQIAREYGVKIALEPLNAAETNILNKVSEGATLVRAVSSPEIVLLADAFHMAVEGETAAVILENTDIISHIHVSEAPGRVWPGKFGGEYLVKLGKELVNAGFNKDLTVECCFDDFTKEGPEAFRFVKEKML